MAGYQQSFGFGMPTMDQSSNLGLDVSGDGMQGGSNNMDAWNIGATSYLPPSIQAIPIQPNQSQQQTQSQQPPLSHTNTHTHADNNAFLSILAEMPSSTDDPARHSMWMEAVRYKTKSLELAIAEARRKEREAELELAKLKSAMDRRTSFRSNEQPVVQQVVQTPNTSTNQTNLNVPAPDQTSFVSPSPRSHSFTTATYPYLHTRPMLGPARTPQQQKNAPLPDATQSAPLTNQTSNMAMQVNNVSQMEQNREHAMTPFDLEAILQGGNLDNMFSWLPDFGATGSSSNNNQATTFNTQMPMTSNGIDPNALRFSTTNLEPFSESAIELDYEIPMGIKEEPSFVDPSPTKRRSSSAGESTVLDEPPAKKSRKGMEKKVNVEQSISCSQCGKHVARIMLRALRSHMPDPIVASFTCLSCHAVAQPTAMPDPAISGTSIGTVDSRKRLRAGMEADDEESEVESRRQFCDVCQRVIASGSVKGGKEMEPIGFMVEVVCSSCDARYQRCTDCGGGGGPRLNVGKWRLKEVFQPGRKTCGLSHSRLGDRQRDIGVHVTPSDFSPEQLNEVLTRCKALWQEKNLSRLAVPEMLEIDLPPNLINPLRSYADIEKIIVENWPSREAMIKAEGADPARFKRILGLTWAHTRPRRNVRTVDIEEEHARAAEIDEDEDTSTVLENVRRTNVVIPAGCELIGMWGGEWDMQHGSILISTFIPFEGTDGEDSTALSVGEIITKVHTLRQTMNDDSKAGQPVPPCEHLWVVSGSTVPLVRERMADILTRKRSFVHLEEYLTRHPDFANAVKDRPYGLHPTSLQVSPATADAGSPAARPLILARWLGNDFNPDKIREIKQMEFGGKARLKRKGKKA